MIKALQPYLDKISKLSLREQAMLCAAAGTVGLFMAQTVLLSPLERQRSNVAQTVAGQRAEIAELDAQIAELRALSQRDPESVAQGKLREVRARLKVVDGALQGVEKQLVPPERIPGLLDEMLKPHRSLQLVSLRTLPVVGLISGDPAKGEEGVNADATPPEDRTVEEARSTGAGAEGRGAAEGTDGAGKRPRSEGNIFKHGVEITLRGGYLDMLDYLAQLERYPLRMYWGRMKLDACQAAGCTMVLTVYTLSLDKAWLRISDS